MRHDTPESRRLWEGISVTDSLDAAHQLAARFPAMGRFIAVLSIVEGGSVTFEQTTNVLNHHTLRGTPHDMLRTVVAVMPL